MSFTGLPWAVGGAPSPGAHRTLNRNTGQPLIVKPARLGSSSDEMLAELEKEVARLEDLRHPNVAQVLGHRVAGGWIHIHSEACVISLAGRLAAFGQLGESLVKRDFRQIVEGVRYLHARGPAIPHGNIKGSNILVGTDGTLKLTDCVCWSAWGGAVRVVTACSLRWAAPEVVRQVPGDRLRADIWSVGCVLVEMATAEHPWYEHVELDAVREALQGGADGDGGPVPKIPDALSESARDFARCCLKRRPETRPHAGVLVEHPFIAQ